ncbi:hypothetical protein BDZ90DRAFT_231577 [Jaminaea rosea]|uniref:CCHC-type domain-containing protein n=1 Tax=Jaminaea rosea TaxID=1569628 RepID=A0A316UUB8_9BASI|nr:hypothetical protein BDZ90DRAFT_231577 [Jaminaea rosea]PWN28594.1 hypothetical protein BDZ90DRAFT_231577 [Jaminaea rosea]
MSSRQQQGGPSRISRPAARYRPGKAPVGAAGYDDSDSDDDEHAQRQQAQLDDDNKHEEIRDLTSGTAAFLNNQQRSGQRRTAGVVVNVGAAPVKKEQQPKEEEYDSDEYETDTDDEPQTTAAGAERRSRPAAAAKESSSEYETDSGEEDESSEEEEEPEPIFKPMFVSKKQREAAAANGASAPAVVAAPGATAAAAPPARDDSEAAAERVAAARRLEAQQLASDRIKAELLAKQADESRPDIDDTDDVDPEAEFAAWRIRELTRIKREWEADELKDQEEAERSRRAALTQAQRDAEDLARAESGRKEVKESRGKMGFMQKYYHKGAFFQDLDILKKRDYRTEATEGQTKKENLPAMMQVRDYGKKGRSKWTHLGAEDTSKGGISLRGNNGGGSGAGASSSQSGCFRCGAQDHLKRDCPMPGDGVPAGPGGAATGANAAFNDRDRPRDEGWRSRPAASVLREERGERREGCGGYSERRETYSRPRHEEPPRRDYGDRRYDEHRYDDPRGERRRPDDRDAERERHRDGYEAKRRRSRSPPTRSSAPAAPPVKDRWAQRQLEAAAAQKQGQ